jgi:hypothetical protein
MKQVIPGNPKESSQFLVVSSHDLSLGYSRSSSNLAARVGYLKNVKNILNSAESLSVQMESRCSLQLSETSLKVKLNGFGSPSFPTTNLYMNINEKSSKMMEFINIGFLV